jgi:hypothetical protein
MMVKTFTAVRDGRVCAVADLYDNGDMLMYAAVNGTLEKLLGHWENADCELALAELRRWRGSTIIEGEVDLPFEE